MSSRRDFIKDVGLIGAGVAVVGALANEERKEDNKAKRTKKELDKLKDKK